MKYAMNSENSFKIITDSPQETFMLGKNIGYFCYGGLTILLFDSLDAGKTQITQGIGSALDIKRIKSPTFIIVSEHEGKIPLAHADLYRLNDFAAVDSLDLESNTDDGGVLIVEWAERWATPPITDRWDIRIEKLAEKPDSREITVSGCGNKALESLTMAFKKMG